MSHLDGRRRPKLYSPVCTMYNSGRCPVGLWSQSNLINDDKGEWDKVATFGNFFEGLQCQMSRAWSRRRKCANY